MVNAKQQLFDSYEQLIAIYREQLCIAAKTRYDEQLDEIRALEQKKQTYQAKINQIRLNDETYSAIIASFRSEVTSYIGELQAQNEQLQHIINNWYAESSTEMKQVSTHRKTLQTYGGVNYSDVISYYIDSRK